jgi:hypothetical protein
MTPPIDPEALHRVLQTLPSEAPDPFPHLASLTPTALLKRRLEITEQLKILEKERQAIDAELLDTFSYSELRKGIVAPGGWILRSRSRTSWIYPQTIKEAIQQIQKTAQISGDATELRSTYLVLTQEGH